MTIAPRRQPGEWEPHDACWIAWPSHAELWQDELEPARRAFVAMARGIAEGERLEVLVPNPDRETEARAALEGLDARFHRIAFGDIWLRDTAPIFVQVDGRIEGARFRFNGWGGKYLFEEDPHVGEAIAAAAGLEAFETPIVLEGGALDGDGEGTVLTTRQCLLAPNRNPGLDQAAYERHLATALGYQRTIWLGDGLQNDHTDGHVDTIARFVAPGVVACMEPAGTGDPNAAAMRAIIADLEGATDARGRRIQVLRVPSPGAVLDTTCNLMPASYLNFYIGNASVVVPVYGAANDDAATRAIEAMFPGRRTIPIDARAVLSGGGAFHCITQQQPSPQ
ncbi:MAG TPA: agmatine deiminase family protein [Kofleriaceae bacterium]|nr:agmatine deiminase family protein [Kofleriaceae bacterium]